MVLKLNKTYKFLGGNHRPFACLIYRCDIYKRYGRIEKKTKKKYHEAFIVFTTCNALCFDLYLYKYHRIINSKNVSKFSYINGNYVERKRKIDVIRTQIKLLDLLVSNKT